MDCQFGALGELADKLDDAFKTINDKIQSVQNKINQIPGMIDAELAAQIQVIKQKLKDEFPQLKALTDIKNALPEEIKQAVAFANDAVAFATEVERLADKYKDADLDLLKDPQNITNLLRDLQGDLNRLCDLVPTFKTNDEGDSELRGRGNTKIEVRTRPNIDVKSLLKKQGRKAALRSVVDSLKSVRIVSVDEEGSGKISKNAMNNYGY